MAVDKKNRIKRAVLTWLCVAALVSGAVPDSFSGYVPTVTMTAAAEDQQTYVSEIDLQQIVNYSNGTTAIPTGVRIYSYNSNGYELVIEQTGTYKLKGSNYINDSYVDVTIRCSGGVNATIFCDDVYIKNDYGYHGFVSSGGSGYAYHSSYSVPFNANESTMTISGNVTVETYFCQTDNYSAPLTYGNVNGSFCTVTYKDANENTLGRTHYLSGSTYSDKSGITDGKCLYTMDGEGKKTAFSPTTITSDITVYCADDHSLPDANGKCQNCGVQLIEIWNVTVDDGINIPSTYRVADTDTFDSPADPTAPLGKKFAGWYVGDTEYDFSKPVTSDITLTAHYEDSLIKSVALAQTSNVEDEYIEGNTFDPTGLVMTVTYEDARTEDITYNASNTKFSFTPLLMADLATTDEKVTVSYGTAMDGGSNCVVIPITVAAKQVSEIAIKTAPTKTKYMEGEKFDPTGLVITASYDNGTSENIEYSATSGITFAPTAELTTADTKVTFTYGGKTAVQEITVAARQLSGIAIKTKPTKTTYIEGEKFDPTGLVITASYDNSPSEDIAYSETSGITFAPTAELTTADNKVTFTYGGKTAEQTITVSEKQVTDIAIKTAPTKTKYIEGEKFNPAGLVITASYDNGTSEDIAYSENSGITVAPTGELTTADTKVTITYGGKTAEQSITVRKKSSGGSSGGSSRPSRPTTPTNTNPSIGGSSKSWGDVAADLNKLPIGSEATVQLNGSTSITVDVIKAISDKDSKVTLAIDSTFAWVVDGSKIITPAAADLTFIKTASTKSNGLRGTEGTQFKINNTGVPTSLEISFKTEHAGKFANLYKSVDGKLEFVTCAKLGEDGKVILPDVSEKGNYVAMLCELSDRLGDMDNDGVMDAKDASAILKDIVGLETGKNPLMADFNGDGHINAMDAAAILKKIVGLA